MQGANDLSGLRHMIENAANYDVINDKSFYYAPINGTKTKIYIKFLTGTTDADNKTEVAHGITGIDNIYSVVVSVFNGALYSVSEFRATANANLAFFVEYSTTNIVIDNVGINLQGNNYRIKIEYIT